MTEKLKSFRGHTQGFTLLEILVSLAILGIAIVMILQLFSASLRNVGTSEGYYYAELKAMEKMREVMEDDKLKEGSSTDTGDERYTISVDVKPVMEERTTDLNVQMLDVTLNLQWNEGSKKRTITLNSMKLVEKEI